MHYVLTLIAPSRTSGPPPLTLKEEMVRELTRFLQSEGADEVASDWLARGEALDLHFRLERKAAFLPMLKAALAERTAALSLDFCLQVNADRRKKLLLADMESTIIEEEMLDEIAAAAGLGPEIAEVTRRAMAGELDFETSLSARVALLKGLPLSLLEELKGQITYNPGAATLVATMKASGARTVLVSGGFSIFAQEVARHCGFEEVRSNRLELSEERLTGRVLPPILGRSAKLEALQEFTAGLAIGPAGSLCVGDGANDLAMLEAAGLGVGYHPKDIVRERAGATVERGNLTALLFFQGYRSEEFVSV